MLVPDRYGQAVGCVSLLQRVAAALDEGTMSLDAQPIVDLRTGAVTCHERPDRRRDVLEPELGPADFLRAAERSDLVLQLDRWVLEGAIRAVVGVCRDLTARSGRSRFSRSGLPPRDEPAQRHRQDAAGPRRRDEPFGHGREHVGRDPGRPEPGPGQVGHQLGRG